MVAAGNYKADDQDGFESTPVDPNEEEQVSFEDRHPEKRRKQAFKEYEERRIKEIKEDEPKLKLSQIKERIFKEWQKSSENPMNQIRKGDSDDQENDEDDEP